ncbi:MAG: Sensor histidine kinase TmoS [Syntrophaceae bacterium PtaU1.Bin231]|jgi:PAS domain S-box-containing protein|nr:MAG: Sensor histidine kinase TmoS [Syntrophaceae bacterium PtaU1.Bin231]
MHRPLRTYEDIIAENAALKERVAVLEETEAALRESEEKYRLIAENTADVIAVLDRNLRFTFISPSVQNLCGFTAREAMAQPLDRVLAPPSFRKAMAGFDEDMKLAALGIAVPTDSRILEAEVYRKDGTVVWAEISFTYLLGPDGKPAAILTVTRDIAARKEAEEALRDAEKRFLHVTENTREMIWEVDRQGLYRYVSPAVEQILGYRPDELVGKKYFYDLFAPEFQEATKSKALAYFQGLQPFYKFVNLNRHRNGRLVALETTGVPVLDERGNLRGYRGADMDVTARMQVEEEREKLITQLQNALAEVKKLSGMLPICSCCKKIRDDKGYWNLLEAYIQEHSEAEFSHSLCPDCASHLYPGFKYRER